MDFYTTIFELIDLRSFSNLWYWIALAVMWSSTSHWVLGVPFDMVQRASKGDAHMQDLEEMTRLQVRRLLMIGHVSGLWIIGFAMFLLTTLAILAFFYAVEFAQAVFLLVLPMAIVGAMSVSAAQRIQTGDLFGSALVKTLTRHRFRIQLLGVLSIFVTAMWGMYQNLQMGAL